MVIAPEAYAIIRQYSVTWYQPIMSMPGELAEATACAYLCMRGVDEIEDHPDLDSIAKARMLRAIASRWEETPSRLSFDDAFREYSSILPEVSLRLSEWSTLAPSSIAPRIIDTFSVMAARMADWAEGGFRIATATDLSRYTYAVGSTLTLLLSDLWAWYDGTSTNRTHAVAYGRALQIVNIICDKDTDRQREVVFWPDGWDLDQMLTYLDPALTGADQYVSALRDGPAREFCITPLATARRAVEKMIAAVDS
ncbi:squalene/phytoene synthase family protein [Nocardia sp. NPDC004750]